MRRLMPSPVTVLVALAVVALCLGCGGEAVTADTAPFDAAVGRYLKARSMGMKVAGFESLEVTGDTARGVCRMQVADDLYGIAVRWTFAFGRTPGGAWRVQSHEAGRPRG